MRKITKLTMKDVRCFKGEQSINIRPITLLVGENSGGKSTVLGCYHAILYFLSRYKLDFNVEPFEMGSFADIIRKDKNAHTEFMIGVDENLGGESVTHQLTFGQNEGDTTLRKSAIKFSSGGSITIEFNNKNKNGNSIKFITQKTPNNFLIRCSDIAISNITTYIMFDIIPSINRLAEKKDKDALSFNKFTSDKIALINNTMELSFSEMIKTFIASVENFSGIAPIRSKPKRTYNPFSGQAPSEGDEVPLFMRRLMLTNKKAWKYLHQELVKFGELSGMYKDIKIRIFNDNMGDPFQIQVKHDEHYVNIMDVGYGVSQILPILVSIIMTKYNSENINSEMPAFFNPNIPTRLLLQEPEMHLHPQAQATFGSLLVNFAENGKGQNFIVETHSDFIVDRIRMEISKGRIAPENVSLVYHEMKKERVQLHNISFDKEGNLLNVPNSYRKFFMKEARALLGF